MTDTAVVSLVMVGALVAILGILRLRHVSLASLTLSALGAIVGLLLGALASVPLSKLPQPWGAWLPVGVSVILTIGTLVVVLSQRELMLRQISLLRRLEPGAKAELKDGQGGVVPSETAEGVAGSPVQPRILVDTSVIIDGRIADIATAGFIPGRLLVPRFVLAELQNIADSDDAMRRGRGRRGLEVLNRLREMPDISVEITEEDAPHIKEVDAKLVALALRFEKLVLTTDYNLNRVAQIQGVRVLNVNELSNAIRPVVLPGEELLVRVVQPGKERNQGVGSVADGTMIVGENGGRMIGQEVATEVTRVFQTVAGKMIFAAPKGRPVPAATPDPTTLIPTAQPEAVAGMPAAAPVAATTTPHRPNGKRGPRGAGRSRGGSGNGQAPTDGKPAPETKPNPR